MSLRWLLVPALVLLAGCGEDEASAGTGGASGDGGICQLGTLYPSAGVIDPDSPVFSDEMHTQADVTDLFAKAKAESSPAYAAYLAARENAGVLGCAFCACGCASSIGHLSAVDCFKDLHGFT